MSLFHRFKERFGTAGVVIAVIALVMALVTGAYAAGGGLSGKQKKEVKKIAKSEAQKYANSNPGAEGKQGPAGKDGAAGKNGAAGEPGAPGAPGAPGRSVLSEEEEPGANCEDGGYSFEVEGSGETNYVCNGTSSSGELEPGEQVTGIWSVNGTAPAAEDSQAFSAIDFGRTHRHNIIVEKIMTFDPPTTQCPGELEHPEAVAPSEFQEALCLYVGSYNDPGTPALEVGSPSGVVVGWQVPAGTTKVAAGRWALARAAAP
jgi:Collagen triple helix repeat (20 copies)